MVSSERAYYDMAQKLGIADKCQDTIERIENIISIVSKTHYNNKNTRASESVLIYKIIEKDIKKVFNYNKLPRNFAAVVSEIAYHVWDIDHTTTHTEEFLAKLLENDIIACGNFVWTANETVGGTEVDESLYHDSYSARNYETVKQFGARLSHYQSMIPSKELQNFYVAFVIKDADKDNFVWEIELFTIDGAPKTRQELVQLFQSLDNDTQFNNNAFFLV